jgi:hypothetical protein
MKTQSEGRGGTSGAKAAPEMRDCPRCGKPTTVWRGKWGAQKRIQHDPPSSMGSAAATERIAIRSRGNGV